MPDPRIHNYSVGHRHGMLTVTGSLLRPRSDGRNRRLLIVLCDCGVEKEMMPNNFVHAKSCGCMQKVNASKANRRHGAKSKTATDVQRQLLTVWRGMRQRCYNPNSRAFPWYGAKGVTIEWETFDDFYTWAVQGYRMNERLEIDRIDPTGNYGPDNCIWSPKSDNLARAHLLIDKDLKVQATRVAKDSGMTFTELVEAALVRFLDAGKEVVG